MRVTPELSITYGTFKVGGDQTSRILRDISSLDQTYEEGNLEYRFTIKQATAAALKSEIALIEAAFTMPYQNVSVDVGGTNFLSWSHSASTGFNAYPEIIKRGEPTDSVRSRTYTVRVKVGLPAGSSTSSRRVTKTSINVSYSPARRKHVSISVEYTALGASGSFSNYGAAADAYATTVLNAIGGTYKLAEQPTTDYDDADKVVRATRVYEEIIFTGIGASDPDVRRESFTISRNKVGPGDTPQGGTINRLVTLNVNYECWINKEASTDLRGKWVTLLPLIMTQVQTTLGSGSVALVSEDPHFDPVENKITANLVTMGSTTGGIIENRITTEIETLPGLVFVPVWWKGPYDRYIYEGPATERKTVTIVQKILASVPIGMGGGGGGGIGAGGGGGVGLAGGFQGFGPSQFNFGNGTLAIFGGPLTGAQQTALVQAVMGDGAPAGGGGGDGGGGGGGAAGGGGKGSFYPISIHKSSTPIRLGIGGYTLDVEEVTIVAVAERADPVEPPSSDVASISN